MNWKNIICLNLDRLRSVEEIHDRAVDVKQYLVNCQNIESLAVLEEQAMKAAIMCKNCTRRLSRDISIGALKNEDGEYLVCIRCKVLFKSVDGERIGRLDLCPVCGSRLLEVKGR